MELLTNSSLFNGNQNPENRWIPQGRSSATQNDTVHQKVLMTTKYLSCFDATSMTWYDISSGVTEWLRRRASNLTGPTQVGSNPIVGVTYPEQTQLFLLSRLVNEYSEVFPREQALMLQAYIS